MIVMLNPQHDAENGMGDWKAWQRSYPEAVWQGFEISTHPPHPFPWPQCFSNHEQNVIPSSVSFFSQTVIRLWLDCAPFTPFYHEGVRNVLASHITELKEAGTSWSGICEVLSPDLKMRLVGKLVVLGWAWPSGCPQLGPGRSAVKGRGWWRLWGG